MLKLMGKGSRRNRIFTSLKKPPSLKNKQTNTRQCQWAMLPGHGQGGGRGPSGGGSDLDGLQAPGDPSP